MLAALLANPWISVPLGALKALRDLLRSVPWQAWVAVAVLIAGYAWGEHRHTQGIAEEVARVKAREIKLQQRIAAAERKSAIATARIVTKVEWRTRTIRERGATIIKEVPRYVPMDACPLPGGFRVLHNAAAAGVLPDPARIPDAAPVPAQAAAVTVAANYGTCQETAAAYCGLIEFGTANGWPVPAGTAEACRRLEVPPKQAAK